MSSGESIDAIDIYRNSSNKLARLQRKLKLKTKFSNNWRKITKKIATLHSKIANTREDFLHKASSNISKSHSFVKHYKAYFCDPWRSLSKKRPSGAYKCYFA